MKEEEAKKKIQSDIENLMIEFGPDGHCDGSDKITEYIMELLKYNTKYTYEK